MANTKKSTTEIVEETAEKVEESTRLEDTGKLKLKKADQADEREEIFIPKGSANEDPNMFVSVNGTNYLLPKGKTSKVPPHIAAEIRRSLKAQETQDSNIDKLLNESK